MKKSILVLTVAAFSTPAFAGSSSADLAPDIYNTTTPTTTTTTTNQTPFPVATPPPKPAPTPAPTPTNASINPAANQGKQSQDSGSGANAAAGAALIAAGMALMSNPPTVPAGAALIAMGALALAQSGHDSGAADQSAATAASSYNGVTGSNGATEATNPALGKGSATLSNPALKQGTAALKDAGYSLTPAGLVNPDGTTTPNSAFNSAGGMAAAGMDASTVAAVQKALGAVNTDADKMKVSSVGLAEGGGSGATGAGGGGADYSFAGKGSAFSLSDAAKRQMVAGKTVMFDGDPIGVRGQNIFDMIHTAYQKKRERNDFLGDEMAAGPAMRSPASVAPAPAFQVKPAAVKPPARNNR